LDTNDPIALTASLSLAAAAEEQEALDWIATGDQTWLEGRTRRRNF